MEVRVGAGGERHVVPAVSWAASFAVCVVGDALLGRWVLLPLFVAAFYGGMIVIDLVTYPVLSFWRGWLRRRGLLAWYLVEVVGLWGGTTVLLFVLSPWWLGWGWDGALLVRVIGAILALVSVLVGTWAVAKMGWARLLFAGALFPPGAGAEENNVPQRLVLEGPYRYVRNPLYDTDFALILGSALLTSNWFLVLLAALYAAQLALQLPLEERELRQRFGQPYRRYCEVVPRFVPRLRPVDRQELE
ncbi:methyltransferase family protein [Rubrobacter tropicus]|uniref:methyltransferase family protein n=1 Tax=Rubrobacter tropicus TaxID=2653851 RepID=UPI00140C2A86|nr:isoprenylcysteine carboxylmethyltransferase family protein [Rubrobacter tropicus]